MSLLCFHVDPLPPGQQNLLILLEKSFLYGSQKKNEIPDLIVSVAAQFVQPTYAHNGDQLTSTLDYIFLVCTVLYCIVFSPQE